MSIAGWLATTLALSTLGLAFCLYRTQRALERSRACAAEHARSLDTARRDLDEFVHLASHDLQEPVRAIDGYTKLLALRYRDKLDDDAIDFIDYATAGAARVTALVHGLLAYSRVHTRETLPATIELEHTFADVVAELRGNPDLPGVQLDCGPLPKVRGDAGQLGTLIRELLLNCATHHDKAGTTHVRVRADACDDGGTCRFVVEDDGPGISPDRQECVFEPFRRLSGRGAGMGLAICRRIVTRHGGRIHVESADPRGARLVFTLPRA